MCDDEKKEAGGHVEHKTNEGHGYILNCGTSKQILGLLARTFVSVPDDVTYLCLVLSPSESLDSKSLTR